MSVAANRYAKALIDALPSDQAEAGYDQLLRFTAILREHSDARRLFENPTVPADRRKAFLQQIAGTLGFTKEIRNFIEILIERNRLDILDEIIAAYQKFLDAKLGIVRAKVTAAQPLDDTQRTELSKKLETVTGKRVRMDVSVDPNLLGGVVARVGTTIYDGSLRQQLQTFRARLAQS
jgi:F-type H+-transporting ATPase subunit delta